MKLLLIGPSKAGKSVLASFLAGMLDSTTPAAEPPPTVGVRILELTCVGQAIELWDVSGDQSYENTWPAVQQGADGVIMCYSPETPGHAVRASSAGASSEGVLQLTDPPAFPASWPRPRAAHPKPRSKHTHTPVRRLRTLLYSRAPAHSRARRRSWSCSTSGSASSAACRQSAARALRCRSLARAATRWLPAPLAACSQRGFCCAQTAARACGAPLSAL